MVLVSFQYSILSAVEETNDSLVYSQDKKIQIPKVFLAGDWKQRHYKNHLTVGEQMAKGQILFHKESSKYTMSKEDIT